VTAIELMLIASGFLVVGSAFGGVVLATGVTGSGPADGTARGAIVRSSGGLELSGPVVGYTDGIRAVALSLDVSLAIGGEGVDLDPLAPASGTVVTYVDRMNGIRELPYTVQWTVGDGDATLEDGELAALLIDVSDIAPALTSGRAFQIEVRPPGGASLAVRRTMPPGSRLDTIVNLQ